MPVASGSPALMYLAAAGVGTIGVVDDDVVDASNLQRQVVHGVKDVGRPKTESAAETVAAINPLVTVVRHDVRLTSENALEILADYDVVLDGADNFPTRYLVNDACVFLGRPHVWGSIYRFDGQVSVWFSGHGPCYRCVFPDPPPPDAVPSCATGGVLGVLCAAIGSVQVAEAVKLIVGQGEPLVGRLLVHDALRQTWDTLTVRADPGCPVCGESPTVTSLVDYEQFCGMPGASAGKPAQEGAERVGAGREDAAAAFAEVSATDLAAMLAERAKRRPRVRAGRRARAGGAGCRVDPGGAGAAPRPVPGRDGRGRAATRHTRRPDVQVGCPVRGGGRAARRPPGGRTSRTSPGECSPGCTTSTRACRSTEGRRWSRSPGA